jgi:hypothetical protein
MKNRTCSYITFTSNSTFVFSIQGPVMQLATFDGIVQTATTGQPITATSSYSSTCTDILIPVTKVHVVPPGNFITLSTVPGRFAPNPVRPESRSPPESFRPYSHSPRVVSPLLPFAPGRFAPISVRPGSFVQVRK